jgi:uroporphyrinogen decarboxylase
MPGAIERVNAALELREPDRVPVMDLMNEFSSSNTILGKRPNPLGNLLKDKRFQGFFDWLFSHVSSAYLTGRELERLAYLGAEAAVEMGYDAAWISYFPVFSFRDSRTMVDIFGRLCDVSIDEAGNVANPIYREGLIKSPEDWKAWPKRDILRLPEKVNRGFKDLQRKYGERLFIFGFANYGIFESAWQPMGFERFVIATRKEKDFLRRVINFYADLQCMLYEAMADAGIPGVIYTDDLAYKSGPMLNPKLIEELFGDHYRRMVATVHGLGMKIVMHSCGNITPLLDWFADCGFDAVHPLEPTAGVELAQAKRSVGDRLCLIGNLDVSHILVDAGREEVFEAVRQAIKDAGPGGGFILAPDHSHPAISVQRLKWMVEAAGEYGDYPLDLDAPDRPA